MTNQKFKIGDEVIIHHDDKGEDTSDHIKGCIQAKTKFKITRLNNYNFPYICQLRNDDTDESLYELFRAEELRHAKIDNWKERLAE